MTGRVTSCLTARKRHYIHRAIPHYSWYLHGAESRHCARPRLRRQSSPTNAMKWLLLSLLCLPCTGCGLAAAPCRVTSAVIKIVPVVGGVAAAPTDACAEVID